MRAQLFGSILLVAAVGCGGGGKKNEEVDAKVFMDAAPDAPAACAVPATLMGLNFTVPAAMARDWFLTPMMGPNMGRLTFSLIGGYPMTASPMLDAIIVEYARPTGGQFTTGAAVNFDTNPVGATTAISVVLGDCTVMNNTIQSCMQEFFANSGSVTFTTIAETQGSTIAGMVASTNYRQINSMTGADVPGGCTTNLPGMMISVAQGANTTPFEPAGDSVPLTLAPEYREQLLKRQALANQQ
jgi:hypothetical protein